MKKTLFLAVTALLTLSSAQAQNTLRLMTYNIKNANGMDNVQNFQRVANVINNACPDAVAIQELDSMTNRSGKTYVLGEIAERTQMHAYFAPAIDYDGGNMASDYSPNKLLSASRPWLCRDVKRPVHSLWPNLKTISIVAPISR